LEQKGKKYRNWVLFGVLRSPMAFEITALGIGVVNSILNYCDEAFFKRMTQMCPMSVVDASRLKKTMVLSTGRVATISKPPRPLASAVRSNKVHWAEMEKYSPNRRCTTYSGPPLSDEFGEPRMYDAGILTSRTP